jgi:UDP-2,4-diacetamido-2,4,6-trideoxy-beta-L-altropyranose hydrolase
MPSSRVVIRADASTRIGTGHVMRCLTLADALRARGAQVAFVCRALPGECSALIRARGHACHLLPAPPAGFVPAGDAPAHAALLGVTQEQDAEDTEACAFANGACDLLVVDHYALDARWHRRLRAQAARLLVIDDLADRALDADFLLDQNFFADDVAAARYRDRVPAGCRLLLGPRHALLREGFAAAHAQPRSWPARAQRLLVFLGGVDSAGATLLALDALAMLPPFAQLDVVAGAGNPHLAALRARVAALPGATLSVDVDDMAARMAAADLAIGAAGTTTWERCAAGLPTVTLVVADNQRAPAQAAAAAGLCVSLGDLDQVDAQQMAAAVALLADNAPLRQALGERGKALVDGQGAARVARQVLPAPVRLRCAADADCDSVHAWRNAAENRRHSHDSREIPLADHRRWFAGILADPQRHVFLVGEDAQGPLGVLRYDFDGARWAVSVYLVPGRHGQGLGADLLLAGTAWLRQNRPDVRVVHAEVLADNHASQRIFERAGYRRHQTTYLLETAP